MEPLRPRDGQAEQPFDYFGSSGDNTVLALDQDEPKSASRRRDQDWPESALPRSDQDGLESASPRANQDEFHRRKSIADYIEQLHHEKQSMEKFIITRDEELDYVFHSLRSELNDLQNFCRTLQRELNVGPCPVPKVDNDGMVMAHICDLHTKVSQLKLQLFKQQLHISRLEAEAAAAAVAAGAETLPPATRLTEVINSTRGRFQPYGSPDLMMAMVDSCHLGEVGVPIEDGRTSRKRRDTDPPPLVALSDSDDPGAAM